MLLVIIVFSLLSLLPVSRLHSVSCFIAGDACVADAGESVA